jgi:hypothetical protein
MLGGGQPAISPWAFVPQQLSHPFVPVFRSAPAGSGGRMADHVVGRLRAMSMDHTVAG